MITNVFFPRYFFFRSLSDGEVDYPLYRIRVVLAREYLGACFHVYTACCMFQLLLQIPGHFFSDNFFRMSLFPDDTLFLTLFTGDTFSG